MLKNLVLSKYKVSSSDTIYYHGRNKDYPYYGNSIYLTESKDYADRYVGLSGKLMLFKLKFTPEKIFTIKNPAHIKKLEGKIYPEGLKNIKKFQHKGKELDWGSIGYLNNEEYEDVEDLLPSLGFLGIKLQEPNGYESVLVFNQNNVEQVKIT